MARDTPTSTKRVIATTARVVSAPMRSFGASHSKPAPVSAAAQARIAAARQALSDGAITRRDFDSLKRSYENLFSGAMAGLELSSAGPSFQAASFRWASGPTSQAWDGSSLPTLWRAGPRAPMTTATRTRSTRLICPARCPSTGQSGARGREPAASPTHDASGSERSTTTTFSCSPETSECDATSAATAQLVFGSRFSYTSKAGCLTCLEITRAGAPDGVTPVVLRVQPFTLRVDAVLRRYVACSKSGPSTLLAADGGHSESAPGLASEEAPRLSNADDERRYQVSV
jgi:hypothetical protein